MNGRTLLLVGGGGIAALVAPIARGFGMRVVVADPYLAPEAAHELGVGLAASTTPFLRPTWSAFTFR